jgi:hypothetical protein
MSQTPIKDQPGKTYFELLEKTIIEKTIPEKDLLAANASPIPENFMDTLKKYDWVYIGGYDQLQKKYTDYNYYYKEYKIVRFDENGGWLDFSINGYQNYKVVHFNITINPWRHCTIIKSNNLYYFSITTPNEKGYQRILSFNNGVFIYLISGSGKMNDPKYRFIEYYAAVPKGFTWNFNE